MAMYTGDVYATYVKEGESQRRELAFCGCRPHMRLLPQTGSHGNKPRLRVLLHSAHEHTRLKSGVVPNQLSSPHDEITQAHGLNSLNSHAHTNRRGEWHETCTQGGY
jgi:hypothetical protein